MAVVTVNTAHTRVTAEARGKGACFSQVLAQQRQVCSIRCQLVVAFWGRGRDNKGGRYRSAACPQLGLDPEVPMPVQGLRYTRVEDPPKNGGDIVAEGKHHV